MFRAGAEHSSCDEATLDAPVEMDTITRAGAPAPHERYGYT